MQRIPSRAQQNQSRTQRKPNPAQQNPNPFSLLESILSIGYRPFRGLRNSRPSEASRRGLEGRSSARRARAALWSILRDAPSAPSGSGRWFAPQAIEKAPARMDFFL